MAPEAAVKRGNQNGKKHLAPTVPLKANGTLTRWNGEDAELLVLSMATKMAKVLRTLPTLTLNAFNSLTVSRQSTGVPLPLADAPVCNLSRSLLPTLA